MPVKKICRHVGCNRFRTDNSSYCIKHQSEESNVNAYSFMSSHEWKTLYQTKEWKAISNDVLTNQPICQYCHQAKSTEVHHMIPHRGNEEVFFDISNLVALCHDCHTKQTIKEMTDRRYGSKSEREMRRRYGL